MDLGLPAKDMVAVVQELYPKYDKTMQSKCENGDDYGISIRPDAMKALYAKFAPNGTKTRMPIWRRCNGAWRPMGTPPRKNSWLTWCGGTCWEVT